MKPRQPSSGPTTLLQTADLTGQVTNPVGYGGAR